MVDNLMKGSPAVHAKQADTQHKQPTAAEHFLATYPADTFKYLPDSDPVVTLPAFNDWYKVLSVHLQGWAFHWKGGQREHILENRWSRFLMFDLAYGLESLFLPKIKKAYLIYSEAPYKKSLLVNTDIAG